MTAIAIKKHVVGGGDTWFYTVPSGKSATINISVVNRGDVDRYAYLYLGTQDWSCAIEFHAKIPPRGVLERTGLVMTAGEEVWIGSTDTDLTARVHGFEEDV